MINRNCRFSRLVRTMFVQVVVTVLILASQESQFDCRKAVCRNNGTCVYNKQLGTFACLCDPLKWKGNQCEAQISCGDNPCKNGATCSNTTNGYTCLCPAGYGGTDCSVSADPCAQCPQTCIRSGNSSTCPCPWGMFGVFCNYTNFCIVNNTCQNNAACYPFIDGAISNYTCSCPAQFTGRNCEQDVNECALAQSSSRPVCENGGTCVNSYGSFTCQCPTGFSGSRCDMVVNYCNPNPCLNGGTCFDPQGNGQFTCTCPAPYGGALCSTVPATSSSTTKSVTSTSTTSAARHTASSTTTWNYSQAWLSCVTANCSLESNGVCDPQCNSAACNYDYGDCAFGQTPFIYCMPLITNSIRCDLLFANGQCNPQCNNKDCLYDGFDCLLWSAPNVSSSTPKIAQPSQCPAQCVPLYANNQCNVQCNVAACAYDGMDCDTRQPLADYLVLVLNYSYSAFTTNLTLRNSYLLTLSYQLQLVVRIVSVSMNVVSNTPIAPRSKRAVDSKTQLVLSLDNSKCSSPDCISTAATAAQYIAAASMQPNDDHATSGTTSLPILNISTQPGADQQQSTGLFSNPAMVSVPIIAALVLIGGVLAGVLLGLKKKNEHREREHREDAANCEQVQADRATHEPRRPKVRSTLWTPPFSGEGDKAMGAHASHIKTGSLRSRNSSATMLSNATGETGFTIPPNSKRPRLDPAAANANANANANASLYESDDGRSGDGREADDGGASTKAKYPSVACPRHRGSHRQRTCVPAVSLTDAMRVAMQGSGLESPLGPEDSISNRSHSNFRPDMQPTGSGAQSHRDTGSASAPCEAIQEMLRRGMSLDARCEPYGETALHLACRYGQPQLVRQLLDGGADANAQDDNGCTPLHVAIASDSYVCFQRLLEHKNTNRNAKMRKTGQTPLMVAVKMAMNTHLVKQLLLVGVEVNATDANVRTALHWAAAVNNAAAAEQLIIFGADCDVQDDSEETPLFLAAREGSYQVAELLLQARASLGIPDYRGFTPIRVAQDKEHDDIVRLIDQHSAMSDSQLRSGYPIGEMLHHHRLASQQPFALHMSNAQTANVCQHSLQGADYIVSADGWNGAAFATAATAVTCGSNALPAAYSKKIVAKSTPKEVKNKSRSTKVSTNSAQPHATAGSNSMSPHTDTLTSPSSVFTTNNTPPSTNPFNSNSSAPNSTNTSPSHRAASMPIAVAATGNGLPLPIRPSHLDQLQQPSSAGSADSGYGHGSHSISPPHAIGVQSATMNASVPHAARASQSSLASTPSSAHAPTVINTYAVPPNLFADFSNSNSNANTFPRPPPNAARQAASSIYSQDSVADFQSLNRFTQSRDFAAAQYAPNNSNQAAFAFEHFAAAGHGTLSRQASGTNQISAAYPINQTYPQNFISQQQTSAHSQLAAVQQLTLHRNPQYDQYLHQEQANAQIHFQRATSQNYAEFPPEQF